MLQTLTMPKLSPTMTSGEIVRWHKAEGDFFAIGDLLVEIATDKATLEYNASSAGYLRAILLPERKQAPIGAVMAITSTEKDEPISEYTPVPIIFDQEVSQDNFKKNVSKQPILETKENIGLNTKNSTIKASPLAKKIAKQEHLSLQNIVGTGPGGRIMSRDLNQVRLEARLAAAKEPVVPIFPIPEGVTPIPLSPMRGAIAKILTYAKTEIPHFYTTATIEADTLLAEKERLKTSGLHFTINDFIVKAAALALMKHPKIRSHFYPHLQSIGVLPDADIAIAVSVADGIVTPILRAAQKMPLQELSSAIKVVAAKAKEGKLRPEEYSGGSFTITNLGMFGIETFFPILNPPQVAIMAIGAIEDAPLIRGGHIEVGKQFTITIAADHRAIDGSDVAEFIKTFRDFLLSPSICQ